jgi:hypothetical protein
MTHHPWSPADGGLPAAPTSRRPRPQVHLRLVFDIANVLSAHGYPRPDHTDRADPMLALFRFIYQPNQQERTQ